MATISLSSNEGVALQVAANVIKSHSVMVADLLGDTPDSTDMTIPLTNVCTRSLQLILQWCALSDANMAVDPQPKDESASTPVLELRSEKALEEWQATFFKDIPDSDLMQLIGASNYMNMNALLDACCLKVATDLRGKTKEQIRERYNIKNDFTKEDEERIKKENGWCHETPCN